MSKLLVDLSASARNGVSRILQALASNKNIEIAEHLNVDASTLSRMKTTRKAMA